MNATSGTVTVLLADDHVMVREALARLIAGTGDIQIQVVAEAADGREALKLAQATLPDVAVLDWYMPKLNGLDAARKILLMDAKRPRIIVLTGFHQELHALAAVRSGARAYLRKESTSRELREAIREVAAGRYYLNLETSLAIQQATTCGYDREPLTLREREVLQLVAEGNSTKKIALILGMAAKTAEHCRENLARKLNIHDVASLTRYAVREGLILA